jgi:hypothetical protein
MASQALARLIARKIFARNPAPGADVEDWIDEHWPIVAAELEAGLINQEGERLPGFTAEKAIAAVQDWARRRRAERV